MSRVTRGVRLAAVTSVLILGTEWTASRADRLHLDGGGVIQVHSWWIDDGMVYYRDAYGTIGLPHSIVVEIESDDAALEQPAAGVRSNPVKKSPASRAVPREVATRLQEANQALKRGDYDTASSEYRALLDETGADFMEPRVGYAVSLIALGEDELATSVVRDGLARDPQHPALLELRGDLMNRREQVEDALRSWREAFEQSANDRLRQKMLKAERELQAGRDYALTTSSHFNLRYDGQVDSQLTDAMTEFLEELYWSMADTFDLAPRQPITVVLYPEQEFRDVTQLPEWVGGVYDGKVRLPLGGLRRLDPVARRLLTHELTHVFVHAKTRGHAPRWLHEGLAQRLEGRHLSVRDRQGIRQRLHDRAPAEWESQGFSYPIALSLTSHLELRSGFHGLLRVLHQLGEGTDLNEALRSVYGSPYDELCRDWAETVLEGAEP